MKITIASPSFSRNERLRSLLASSFPNANLRYCEQVHEYEGVQLCEFLSDAEIAIIGKERIDEPLLEQLPGLKAIAKYGVGLDRIDEVACLKHGVALLHTPGSNAVSVAEFALGLMLTSLHRISLGSMRLKSGVWQKDGGCDLRGRTVGILGCGHVGEKLARLLVPFSCEVLICDIVDKTQLAQEHSAKQVSFEELLARAQVLSLHLPLTFAPTSHPTYHLINEAAFSLMGQKPLLINTARGAIVDEKALVNALKTNAIQGAGLDVFENEPVIGGCELFSMPNVVCTPHIAGGSNEAIMAMGRAALDRLQEFVISRGPTIPKKA